ncbi:MAG: PhzF family phenazine biosynthesis protein [Paracoccus sp. (in: a-proteobacteria)]|uniref:PhzF family phenazine biosynthesis protein n=1 Tax=Paracoccus sp. TaxID=267 RepID=UPI0026E05331|nr:PhzF family phenazine biosynthesis protein [Paracoccus sp. (in: a-proteobacteria)]MDO5632153.1 PhzF family phenazine biosynthesis protein [Paracoccus sp. (in: a-proteobacteria)]
MLDFVICDVFTDQPFSGNPLAIVMGAGGLSVTQMQIIARQFNLSETIFVMAPCDPVNTARVRIFFPTAEIPFAGHPTIGCALHLAGGADGRIVLEEGAGLVPVTISGGVAEFVAPRLPVAHGVIPDAGLIAAALDLSPGDLGFGGHRVGCWQGGPAFLFVPLASLDTVAQARPIEPHWSRLMAVADVDSAYLYAPDGDGFRARMFSPGAGIPEDPATGSASALLAAQFLAAGDLVEGETRIPLRQGVEMGRPSGISLTVVVRGGSLAEIRIAGRAVPIAQGRIRIPEDV